MIKISFGLRKKKFEISEWSFLVCSDIQQQPNSYNCSSWCVLAMNCRCFSWLAGTWRLYHMKIGGFETEQLWRHGNLIGLARVSMFEWSGNRVTFDQNCNFWKNVDFICIVWCHFNPQISSSSMLPGVLTRFFGCLQNVFFRKSNGRFAGWLVCLLIDLFLVKNIIGKN